MFWALLGIACAATNLHENENSNDDIAECDENSYSLTVRIPKVKNKEEGESEGVQNE